MQVTLYSSFLFLTKNRGERRDKWTERINVRKTGDDEEEEARSRTRVPILLFRIAKKKEMQEVNRRGRREKRIENK